MSTAHNPISKTPEALVAGLARMGDRAAFEELVRRRHSWIRNLMWRFSGDANLADDLAQQVFLQAWNDIPRLRAPNKFPGWLKKIAINTWRQHIRKNDALRGADEHDGSERTQTQSTSVAMDLDRALAELPPNERLCVVLSYHEGMTHDEIAKQVKMPLGTVKSHIRRGSQRLQTLLSAYLGGSEIEESK